MSMQPAAWPEPDPQIAAAVAAMYARRKTPRSLAVQIRDRLGQWLGLQQVIAGPAESFRWGAVGIVCGQCVCDEAEGALNLAVGELVRAVLPVFGHAEPGLVTGGQGGQRGVDPGQVRGPAAGQGQLHAKQ